jgi:ribosomal protein S12 methylthiotransferase accessory factor
MLQLYPLDLDHGPGRALLDTVAKATSPALASVRRHFARAFVLPSPWAAGFCCIGAELALDADGAAAYERPRLSVTGNGETPDAALISCLGEAADRLSVVERPGDITLRKAIPPAGRHARAGWMSQALAAAGEIDWVAADDVVSRDRDILPADFCLRRRPERRGIGPVGALSSGVAAGPSLAAAAVRGALELCERDAAALWWLGGRPAKAFALEHPASAIGTGLIARLRGGQAGRRTTLLDITTDLGIPSVVAVSVDPRHIGLACGFAARLDWENAIRAALLEMCQMELAAPLAQAKRLERGDDALNETDRQHLERAEFLTSSCELLHPRGVSDTDIRCNFAPDDLQGLATWLKQRGVGISLVDLTRPDIGVPAARVVAGELQPYTQDVVTARLARDRRADGGNNLAPGPVVLM